MKRQIFLYFCLSILFICQVPKETVAMQTKTEKQIDALAYINKIPSTDTKGKAIVIDISAQALYLFNNEELINRYPISSSKFGIGNKKNSNKTPLGVHVVQNMIGKNAPLGTIFKARGNTKKIAKIYKDPIDVKTDLVTTRIIWLKGLEPNINVGDGIDSYSRYIYIHGTPEEGLIGQPASHGCIRMLNADVIDLFNNISKKTPVIIIA